MLVEYATVLSGVLSLLAQDRTPEADVVVNNIYHAQKRTRKDFIQLLRLTRHHRAFIEADDDVKKKLLNILFMLDKKNNSPENKIYIEFTKAANAEKGNCQPFRIKDKKHPAL